jgi:levanase/fructan beta-fructosidase
MRNGRYPYMPFNQQMSFPVALSLRTYSEGIRLCRLPVREIDLLRSSSQAWMGHALQKEKALTPDVKGGLFDLHASIALDGDAAEFSFRCHGNELRYSSESRKFSYLGNEVPAVPVDGRIDLRLLVDRTSLELFAENGKVSASFCFLPEACDTPLSITGSSAELVTLEVHELRSAWK